MIRKADHAPFEKLKRGGGNVTAFLFDGLYRSGRAFPGEVAETSPP
jgi:hypothetical protein